MNKNRFVRFQFLTGALHRLMSSGMWQVSTS